MSDGCGGVFGVALLPEIDITLNNVVHKLNDSATKHGMLGMCFWSENVKATQPGMGTESR